MTTTDRIEEIQQILSDIQSHREQKYYPENKESTVEKILTQLLIICRNQQKELDMLTADYTHRLEQKLNQQDNEHTG